ncbi:IS66 family insertion sequence element accessory protein TnpA [Sorangium atrum]
MAEEHSRVPREEWRKRVERWRDSGLTAAEFAGELGINPRTLMYWKWLLARDDKASTPALERRQSPKQARASKQAQLAAAVPVAGDRAGLIEIQSAPADARFGSRAGRDGAPLSQRARR